MEKGTLMLLKIIWGTYAPFFPPVPSTDSADGKILVLLLYFLPSFSPAALT